MNTNTLLPMATYNYGTNLATPGSAENLSHPALWQGWPVNATSHVSQMVPYPSSASEETLNAHPQSHPQLQPGPQPEPQPLSIYNTTALPATQPNLMLNQSLNYPGNPLAPHSGIKDPTDTSPELYPQRSDCSTRELSEAELYDLCYPNREDTSRPFYPPVRRRQNDIPKNSSATSHQPVRYSPYARPVRSEPDNSNSATTHLHGTSMAMPFGAITIGEGMSDKNRVLEILELLQGNTTEARIIYVCRDFKRGVAVLNDSGLFIKSRFSAGRSTINKAFQKTGSLSFMEMGKQVRGKLQINGKKLRQYIDCQPNNAFRNHQFQANHVEKIPIHIKVYEFPEEQIPGTRSSITGV
ncbi:hypothetical protein [Endozoicomonas sp. SCSIO W0465]|uniref:hypothetical protein n=1 Tax=Endozoicomonas sp. SCSIO W0465 TaxID=2918516 RepID=UPI002074B5B3|nr:hypothetical protein [Endozoicomonas sp. SCSIO W0465]USE34766.1 hypothetical protein MJO57_21935 [Endozoicomonas sp. SCSIO W0465]